MTWLQDTQGSLMEKASRAEDFYSHMLLRRGFRNWLKVFPHHSGEIISSEPVAAALSPHHTAASHTCSPTFAELHRPHASNIIPFFRDLLSALHSPSFFFTQNTLLHTTAPTLHSVTLLPADFPPLLSPLHLMDAASAPLCFCLLGWGLGERSHSHLFLCPSSLVQGLSLHSGGDSE